MSKESIHHQLPRVEDKLWEASEASPFLPLAHCKLCTVRESTKGSQSPPAHLQPSPQVCPLLSLPTSYMESLQDQWECEQACWAQSWQTSPSCFLRSDEYTTPKGDHQDHPREPAPLPGLRHLIRILHDTFQSLHPSLRCWQTAGEHKMLPPLWGGILACDFCYDSSSIHFNEAIYYCSGPGDWCLSFYLSLQLLSPSFSQLQASSVDKMRQWARLAGQSAPNSQYCSS